MYAYGAAYDTALPKNDDGSNGPISLGVPIRFFNISYSTIYVNTNGHISFFAAYSNYTALRFPLTFPLIAPFWTDINTLTGGQIYYRESSSSTDLTQAKSDIVKVYFSTFNPTRLYITTWYQVAAYGGTSTTFNTFQLVIVTNGSISFLVFNFEQMSWTSPPSGSNFANFGYNAGDNINYYSHPDSFTANIKNVSLQSNVNVPGKWIFRV
jgi:hypothetical protein